MAKFLNSDIAELAHQLTLAPRRLRMAQLQGIDTVLGMIEPERVYPFEFVCYHITKYHKRGNDPGYSIPGKALIADLVTLAEFISRRANLSVSELNEPYKTHKELAEFWSVSTKTIRRWRDRGLMGLRVVFEDGVNRLAFCQRTIDRFGSQQKDVVAKAASFKQLTATERDRIIDRARQIVARQPVKLHAAAKLIADEMSRAVETVRYTLRRHDQTEGAVPLFSTNGTGVRCERQLAIWRRHEQGEAVEAIALAFDCPPAEIECTLRQVQARKLREMPWDYVGNELFDAPGADALILDAPEPTAAASPAARIPKDLPPYLRSLYLTPLLSAEQEQDLFRRYNYLKFKAAKAVRALNVEDPAAEHLSRITAWVTQIDSVKQRIIRANLRLVVSIAKKHVGWSPDFYEVVSDGNMSLMRAVEKFDYARGNKFSTYASWAIMKNFARSVPEEHYYGRRYLTGQEELLDATADHRGAAVAESDRGRVRELIAAAMKALTPREQDILSGHYGLAHGDGGALTLEQLGRRFGVTKERIRQIEHRAIARLRDLLAPSLADALAD